MGFKLFLIAGVLFLGMHSYSQDRNKQNVKVVRTKISSNKEILNTAIIKAVDLYNLRQYEEALQTLDSVQAFREENPRWYYFKGVTQARLEKNDEALENLNTYINKADIANTSRAYYFLGVIYFYRSEFQKALNSFQAAQDVSTDPVLDRQIDNLIEKTIQLREYYDNHKAGSFAVFLGYEFHTNAIGISQSASQVSLNGHVLNYGFAVAYRFIDRLDLVFEPSVTIVDRYTLDKDFKATSTLQAADVLQAIVSLPVFFTSGKNSTTQYNLSLNAFSLYLPIVSTTRDLYISSVFAKGRITKDLSSRYGIDANIVLGSDTSSTYLTDDDNPSGIRTEAGFILKDYLDRAKTKSFLFGFTAAKKDAKGINARYQRYGLSVGYQFPSFAETSSTLGMSYEYLAYPDKTTPRKDNKASVDYNLTQSLSAGSALLYSANATLNSSDVDSYKYDDLKVGLQYVANIGF